MSGSLPERLLDTGILQFGYFVIDNKVAPVRFCPEYLPAYPDLLTHLGKLTAPEFAASEVDHLIATADSVPLGLVCSLQTGLSMVYSRGRGESAVYDLVGSYNTGHMSALLMNSVEDEVATQKFISNARSVGLETRIIVTLVEMRHIDQLADIPVRSVFRLIDIIQTLITVGRLSEGQAQAVLKWINAR
ncbi:MAG: hypothetical protein H0X30_13415 [Anaerolineae bacterium]|nr:hypothetical protein [Anaerolineae bacterium]